MPQIPPNLIDCVVYVYQADDEDETKIKPGSGGTGFFASVPFSHLPESCAYVVTNSHVVRKDMPSFVRINVGHGATVTKTILPNDWFHHPLGDDVAVTPLIFDDDETTQYAIPTDWMLKKELHSFQPGDHAFFIGRHMTLEGKRVNTPTVRFGNLSMTEVEPVYQGDDWPRWQETLVVEARTFGGYSGSPVFIEAADQIGIPTYRRLKQDQHFPRDPLQFEDEPLHKEWPLVVHKRHAEAPFIMLGMCWGHAGPFGAHLPGLKGMTRAEREMTINSGMMFVVPAWKIVETLMQDDVQKRQAAIEAALTRDEASAIEATTDSAGDDDKGVSLAGVDFEDALRALLRTPPSGRTQGPA